MEKKIDIEKLMDLVLEEADDKESIAAHSGSWNDGGASNLRNQVYFYRLGQKNVTPKEWMRYVNQLDPEWQELQRLQKKFGKR